MYGEDQQRPHTAFSGTRAICYTQNIVLVLCGKVGQHILTGFLSSSWTIIMVGRLVYGVCIREKRMLFFRMVRFTPGFRARLRPSLYSSNLTC